MLAYKLLEDSFTCTHQSRPVIGINCPSHFVPKSDLVTRNGRPVTPNTLQNACAICLVDFEQGDRCSVGLQSLLPRKLRQRVAVQILGLVSKLQEDRQRRLRELSNVALERRKGNYFLLIVGDDFVRKTSGRKGPARNPSGLASAEHDEKDEEDDEYDRTQREMRELQQVSEASRGEEANDAVDRYL